MYSSVNTIWVLVGAALVFFMQAGFAMCEAGFTRAKNTGNILMKNLMDFCIGTPAYWLVGFGVMFAGSGALIGGFDPFVRGDYSAILPAGVPLAAYFIFQTVFCATAATIVSGAMAEHQVHFLLHLLPAHLADRLPHLRPLDLGRRLAGPAGLPRFRRLHCRAHGGRCVRSGGREDAGRPHWQV